MKNKRIVAQLTTKQSRFYRTQLRSYHRKLSTQNKTKLHFSFELDYVLCEHLEKSKTGTSGKKKKGVEEISKWFLHDI